FVRPSKSRQIADVSVTFVPICPNALQQKIASQSHRVDWPSNDCGGDVRCWGKRVHVGRQQRNARRHSYQVPSFASKLSFSIACITSSTLSRTSEWPLSRSIFE